MLKILITLAVLYAVFVVVMRVLYPLPSLDGRVTSQAIPASPETTLGRAALAISAEGTGPAGFQMLNDGFDAYAARILLARSAEQTIDAQYYIWHNDMTGIVLLASLKEAAERGVRVRLLVDDNGIHEMDDVLAALDALPNMEVRIFNPFTLRQPRSASFLFDFPRLNRRMHNKSFTVDGAFSVVGGRNIGDVYFESYDSGVYFDLDVLAVGDAPDAVADSFDIYWSSASAHPMGNLVKVEDGAAVLAEFAQETEDILESDRFATFVNEVQNSGLIKDIVTGTSRFSWAEFQLFADDPAKGLRSLPQNELLVTQLWTAMPQPKERFDLVSAYFIPGDQGADILTGYAQNGLRVRTLTNSLEATDVTLVHSGYAKYRPKLMASGVELYELRADLDGRLAIDKFGVLSFSTSSLHAKAFSVDGKRLFVGSFNFDPRSAQLNTEMGFLIESPEMAARTHDNFDRLIKTSVYAVGVDEADAMVWQENRADGSSWVHAVEPNTTAIQRLMVKVMGWLPIEWAL